ncbi:hypothetical protein SELMODRAFT_415511 [Selaginella moellendorffii]|uniref:PLAT domain-containing protein n=1 Tax=Selaginella moellendorffii TaxID=88036 RepID=D8RWC5_SELML|nr:hypothetical protein SELMODRAFT_415511 [Selaginella moellendorffii]
MLSEKAVTNAQPEVCDYTLTITTGKWGTDGTVDISVFNNTSRIGPQFLDLDNPGDDFKAHTNDEYHRQGSCLRNICGFKLTLRDCWPRQWEPRGASIVCKSNGEEISRYACSFGGFGEYLSTELIGRKSDSVWGLVHNAFATMHLFEAVRRSSSSARMKLPSKTSATLKRI